MVWLHYGLRSGIRGLLSSRKRESLTFQKLVNCAERVAGSHPSSSAQGPCHCFAVPPLAPTVPWVETEMLESLMFTPEVLPPGSHKARSRD